MTKRPPEIQTLIEWLKEPGRKLNHGYGTRAMPCAAHQLEIICGSESELSFQTAKALLAEGDYSRGNTRLREVFRLNDNCGDPLRVAAYLESEFPQ